MLDVKDIVICRLKGFWEVTKIEVQTTRRIIQLKMLLDENGMVPRDITYRALYDTSYSRIEKLTEEKINQLRESEQNKWVILEKLLNPNTAVNPELTAEAVSVFEVEILSNIEPPQSLQGG